jgi:hypothetical protein
MVHSRARALISDQISGARRCSPPGHRLGDVSRHYRGVVSVRTTNRTNEAHRKQNPGPILILVKWCCRSKLTWPLTSTALIRVCDPNFIQD